MAYKIDYDKIDPTQLHVFSESRKRRIFVGILIWDKMKNIFEFRYDQKYSKSYPANLNLPPSIPLANQSLPAFYLSF